MGAQGGGFNEFEISRGDASRHFAASPTRPDATSLSKVQACITKPIGDSICSDFMPLPFTHSLRTFLV